MASILRYISCILLLFSGAELAAQTYLPITVTGFNIDAIAETAPDSQTGTTQSLDGTNHVMYSANFAAGAGFSGGIVNSGTIVNGSRTYQLNPFMGNNCLFLPSGNTGTLSLVSPASYAGLSLLLFSTEGSSNISVTLNYTNGTSTSFGSFNIQDWFFGAGAQYCCFGRCTRQTSGATFDGFPNDPRFYPLDLTLSCADMKKTLQSISINTTSGWGGFIMAASGIPYTQTLTATSTSVSCFGGNNGTATANATGSNAPFAYSWNSAPVQATATASNLTAGNYTCTITDSKSCISTVTLSISQPTSGVTLTTTPANASCGAGNGSITAFASGGNTPYTFAINGGAFSGNSSFTSLGAGVYTVQVKDNTGCLSASQATITSSGAPTISVNSGTICAGSSISLTASGALSYTWNPATGLSSGSGASVSASPATTTQYTVTGTDAGGCSGTATSTVVVSSGFILNVSPASASICPGASATLSASGATSYTWSPATSLNTGSGGTVIASPPASVTYTVTGDNSGCTGTNTVAVTVNPTPTISISPASSTLCAGTNTLLSASGAASYQWSPATGLSASSGAAVTAGPANTSFYTITGTSSLGCTGTGTAQVIVVNNPVLQALSTPTSICEGASANLSASGAAGYTWSPATTLSSSTGPVVTASPSVSTLYTLTGANTVGSVSCQSSTTVQVQVIPKINVTISASDSICIGNSTMLQAGGGNTYAWTPAAGLGNTSASGTSASPQVTTTYSVTVSNNGICPVTATVTLFVNPLPMVNGGPDTTINIDESYVLTGTGNGVMGWSAVDGSTLVCNYCPVVEVAPQNNSCYQLTATNSHGCVNHDEVCITVTKDWDIFIPNAFTPSGDNLNEVFLPMGYGLAGFELNIYNRWGQRIFHSADMTQGWDGKFGGQLCEPGLYVYSILIKTLDGKSKTRTGHITLLTRIK